jgi:hypothetical protein
VLAFTHRDCENPVKSLCHYNRFRNHKVLGSSKTFKVTAVLYGSERGLPHLESSLSLINNHNDDYLFLLLFNALSEMDSTKLDAVEITNTMH